jgi:hypothetical protein
MVLIVLLGFPPTAVRADQSPPLAASQPAAGLPGSTAAAAADLLPVAREQVVSLIEAQGQDDSYYFDGLSYTVTNLDTDPEEEILAKIVGGVHLGTFFIFDQDAAGAYRLITEQDWKVDEWYFHHPLEIAGKKMFQLETRTGGTGISICTMHLCYLEHGKFIEAWQGTLQEECWQPQGSFGSFFLRIGSCQVDRSDSYRMYVWENTWQYQLAPDGRSPQGDVKTTAALTVYSFDGTHFVLDTSSDRAAVCQDQQEKIVPGP